MGIGDWPPLFGIGNLGRHPWEVGCPAIYHRDSAEAELEQQTELEYFDDEFDPAEA